MVLPINIADDGAPDDGALDLYLGLHVAVLADDERVGTLDISFEFTVNADRPFRDNDRSVDLAAFAYDRIHLALPCYLFALFPEHDVLLPRIFLPADHAPPH